MMDPRFSDVLEAVLGVDASQISDDDSPRTISRWDSVTHLQLLLALEVEFDLQFSPEEMAQLSSVGRIRERIERNRNG